MFRRILFLIAILFPIWIAKADNPIPSPSVISMFPAKGVVGDSISFTCTGLPTNHFQVIFNSAAPVEVSEVKSLTSTIGIFNVCVPPGTTTGVVKLVWDKLHLQVIAGNFTLLQLVKGNSEPDDHGIGLRPGVNQSGGGIFVPSAPRPVQLSSADRQLDLPLDKSGAILDPEPPTPPPPPPTVPPTEIPPTIYGKNLQSENGTLFYVIDVSGSMGWDMGQYTGIDGSTQTGDRLDRAKAALTKSIISLPKTFKFNIDSYDCGCYPWQFQLVPADDMHKQAAISWVNNLKPMGATGTGPAMAQALQFKQCHLFVLLTDGAPNCGVGDGSGDSACIQGHLNMICQFNTQHAVIDVFGIGATGDFKQFCLDVASNNGGSYTDVR